MSEDNLEPLVTQCPNCETRFRVTEAQLQVAQGRVRCGACLSVFDGTAYLTLDGETFDAGEEPEDVDQLLEELDVEPIREAVLAEPAADVAGVTPGKPQSAPDAEPQDPDMPEELLALEAEFLKELRSAQGDEEQPAEEQPAEEQPAEEQPAEEQPAEEQAAEDELQPVPEAPLVPVTPPVAAAPAVADEETLVLTEPLGLDEVPEPAASASPEPAEETAHAEPPTPTVPTFNIPDPELPELDEVEEPAGKRSWTTVALIVLALVGLPAQVLWFQYESWVKDARFRPVYQQICAVAGCELPPMRDITQIVSKKSVIRVHPERSDARIVDVLMVNNADFAQPFPLIELMATTIRGQLVAGRRFKPEEYLQGEMAKADLMPPRTPVHVSLEIQDPGEDALNFEVRFR